MSGELQIPISKLLGLALVMTRVAGAVSFVPIPGFNGVPTIAKIILILSISMLLIPVWPAVPAATVGAATVCWWMFCELAFGVTIGVAVSMLNEAFILASQVFGLQAGYGYASTIDPATQADSSVLQLFSNLAAGLLFFSLGFHRQVIRIFAESMRKHPPGSFALDISSGEYLIQLGADMFSIAVRLAIPVVALLMLLDLSLALLSRINSQMQLLTLAFPTKMLVSMGLLTVLCAVMPRLYRTLGDSAFEALAGALRLSP